LTPNSPELSLLKFLPLAYHHNHFLAATLDFTSFFTTAFMGATHFFLTAGLFWIRFHFLLQLHILKLADYILAVTVFVLFFIDNSMKGFDVIMYMHFIVSYLYKNLFNVNACRLYPLT